MIKPVYDKGLIFIGLCILQIQAYFLIQRNNPRIVDLYVTIIRYFLIIKNYSH